MERSLIKQINKKNMAARLNSRHVKPMYYPNFFGVKRVTSLKWETLVGEKALRLLLTLFLSMHLHRRKRVK